MDRMVSWDFILGMLRTGVHADVIASVLRQNDRLDPSWRDSIPTR